MIHVDIGSWNVRPRIRDEHYYMTVRDEGRVNLFVSEGTVSLSIQDGHGEDNPLCEVELTREMLQIALAALDATEDTNATPCNHGGTVDLEGYSSIRRSLDQIADRLASLEADRRGNQDHRTDRRPWDYA